MKLRKLAIHNIASIEDAELDFEKAPLRDADIFLICGETGAGKSMILDCICLALYGTTPRLASDAVDKKNADRTADNITVSDPRNLLRRHTGRGFVKLLFTGSDGVDYEAEWSVQRAHKKPQGNLQARQWTLRNLATDITEKNDVDRLIASAVGLDFSQFCRTTMLAQGEFTRFLISKDNEKAAILEKITGVSAYSTIGRRIYEGTQERKKVWLELQARMEGTQLLSEEERMATELRATELEAVVKEQTALREECARKSRWLADAARQRVYLQGAKVAFESARQLSESEQFRVDCLTVADWQATDKERALIVDMRLAQKEADEADRQLIDAAPLLASLTQLLAEKRSECRQFEKELNALRVEIEAESADSKIYASTQKIQTLADGIMTARNGMAKESEKIVAMAKQLEESYRPELNRQTVEYDEAVKELTHSEKEISGADSRLKAFGLPKLRARRQQLLATQNRIALSIKEMENRDAQRIRLREAEEALKVQAQEVVRLAGECEKMVGEQATALRVKDNAKAIYEKQLDSVDKWAKAVRGRLAQGDVCPVCGHTVDSPLPDEGTLDEIVAVSRQAYEKAQKAVDEATGSLARLKAEHASALRLQQERTVAQKNECDLLAKCERECAEGLEKCGLRADSGLADLRKAEADTAAEAQSADSLISEGEKMELQVAELRSSTEILRKKTERIRAELQTKQTAIERIAGEIEASRRLVKTLEDRALSALSEISVICSECSFFPENLHDSLPDFIGDLSAKSVAYKVKTERFSALERRMEAMQTELGRIEDGVARLSELLPPVEGNLLSAEPCTIDIAEFEGKVRALIHRRAAALTRSAETSEAVRRYMAENPRYGVADADGSPYLFRLADTPASVIRAKDDNIRKISRKLAEQESVYHEAERRSRELEAERPHLSDDDTPESLTERYNIHNDSAMSAERERGTIAERLRTDARQRLLLADLQASTDDARKEYERWARLDSLIGDATGSRFRKIAQSYILESLVEAANGYMSMLSPRYTLRVSPGTFIVEVEDGYQGYVRRPASTVSGGESFLVSLALALALSDIADSLAVDTLFIDEGFGTLSGEPLRAAVATLRSLRRHSGRRVGIISHVEELRERVGVQIRVERQPQLSASRLVLVPPPGE